MANMDIIVFEKFDEIFVKVVQLANDDTLLSQMLVEQIDKNHWSLVVNGQLFSFS